MKILLLYTSHRQIRELEISQFLYNHNDLLKTCDVLLHCNNPNIDKTIVSNIMRGFDSPNTRSIFSSINSGHHSGVAEAIDSVYNQLIDYDFVIHLHPDVFLMYTEKLQQLLDDSSIEDTDYIAWQMNKEYAMPVGRVRDTEYASDFFIFTPKKQNNIFKHFKEYWRENPTSGCERFLGCQIHKHALNIKHLDRGLYGGMRAELEPFGIWHSHNLSQVEYFLHTRFNDYE